MDDTNDILLKLGQAIKEERKRQGLKQLDLEVKAGIDTGDISRIENGLLNISFTKLDRLLKALGLDVLSLFPKKKSTT